jgi:uncharacterized protein YutE (UPF0331/DUF86 family)
MPIYRKDAEKLVQELDDELLMQLDQHLKFMEDLVDDDDWSFVIKSHALIEASITQMLTEHSGDARFKNLFERLPLSDDEMGKILVAKLLNLLEKRERKFVQLYSQLRNKLVHRIENINFSLKAHIEDMDSSARKSWQESITWFSGDNTRSSWKKVAIQTPRIALWVAIFILVSMCSISTYEVKGLSEIKKLALKTAEELFRETIIKD